MMTHPRSHGELIKKPPGLLTWNPWAPLPFIPLPLWGAGSSATVSYPSLKPRDTQLTSPFLPYAKASEVLSSYRKYCNMPWNSQTQGLREKWETLS